MVSCVVSSLQTDERTYEPLQENGQAKSQRRHIRFEHVFLRRTVNIRFWMTFLSVNKGETIAL